MDVYERRYRLRNHHVGLGRKLKTATLFEFLEEASIAHTEALDMGRDKTLDRGLLWVILQQYLTIFRMPSYDEMITVRSWPGDTMHLLFPRYYEILDEEGTCIIEGSALWALIDENTRKAVFPEPHGIIINGNPNERKIDLPNAVHRRDTDHRETFVVPYHMCDLNGHLNNTHYFDIFEDFFYKDREPVNYSRIEAEYLSEVRLHEELSLSYGENEEDLFMEGSVKGKSAFRIRAKKAL